MVCKNCGKEYEGKFCPECGVPAEGSPYLQSGSANHPAKKKTKVAGCLWVVVGILIFVLIVGVVGSAFSSSDSSAGTQVQTSAGSKVENSEAVPSETIGQKNAKEHAIRYIKTMPFSRDGLVDQLIYEGYSQEDAEYGADNCGADWFEQAALKPEDYLDIMPFSREGLIEQLLYEKFTQEQAEYGVEQNGY